MVKANTLGALTAIYSDEPFKDFEEAQGTRSSWSRTIPNDPRNLYAMANLYEKFGKVAEAGGDLQEGQPRQNPNDAKACGALAGFYNKPLWDDTAGSRRSGARSLGAPASTTPSATSSMRAPRPERRRGLPEGWRPSTGTRRSATR